MTVVRMVSVKIKSGQLDEGVRLFRAETLGQARAAQGSEGVYLLTDPATSLGISLNFYASRAEAEADTGAFQQRFGAFRDLLDGQPTIQLLEVAAQT